MEEIESSIDDRVKLGEEIGTIVNRKFQKREKNSNKKSKNLNSDDSTCGDIWNDVFTTDWVKNYISYYPTVQLGTGSYGSVYKVFIRDKPNVPLAIKQTNETQQNEVANTINAGSLVYAKVNPHFNLFFAHLHCESLITPEYVRVQHTLIPWKDGTKQLSQLESLIKENPSNVAELKKERKLIESQMYPSEEDVMIVRNLKDVKEKEYQMIYDSTPEEEVEDTLAAYDRTLLKALKTVYDKMLKIRNRYNAAFDLILMELSDDSFDAWLDTKPPNEQIISALFQICTACLSYATFFRSVHNDLLLHNIMYNNVKNDVYYVYKLGKTYFKVPLYGKLMKLIDFGLSTDFETFDAPDADLAHWCPGGHGSGKGEKRTCTVQIRDILEIFYRMKSEDVMDDRPDLLNWITEAHKRTRDFKGKNMSSVRDLVIELFSAKVLKSFNLESPIQISVEPISVNKTYQPHVFDVMKRTPAIIKRMQQYQKTKLRQI